ncbi:GNAT family N-acetyltransferase [Brevibacillus ruminantium]|uniref:GNAT family N-acetyltransferase n=1 Tax=Brevibacillus ruminantium TaxID=2950604 RepID=A0ABY4WC91_9BACL|nr:GNAT family N-acetyltransferase [Brevibacillus ruminantium]USG64797.1 GNAT family N-acetyltransferase [Brevibacillus ruminantium]
MFIRKARIDEARFLSDLSFRSKAYWGYSDDFMEACRNDLTLTPEYIASSLVFVLEDGGAIRGFMGLEREPDGGCLLKDLFIEPDVIGKGYGRALWNHMLKVAQDLQVRNVTLHSEPYAENFYLLMGAKRIGEIESTVFPGRKLPLLEVEISHQS